MSLNNVNLIGHKEVDGRNLMCNFMKRLTSQDTVVEETSLTNDVASATASGGGGWKNSSAAELFIDKLHLYNDVVD